MSIDFERANTQQVVIGTSSAFQNVEGGSLSAWMLIESVAGTQFIANFSTSTITASRLGLRHTAPNRTALGTRLDGSALAVANGGVPAAAVLVHIGASANYATRALLIYINGVQAGSGTLSDAGGSSSNTLSANVVIAALSTVVPGVYGNTFDGRLQDVRAFDRVLGATEFANLFQTRGRDSIVYGQRHRWKLNQLGAGLPASDEPVQDTGALATDGTAAGLTIDPEYAPWLVSSRRRRHR